MKIKKFGAAAVISLFIVSMLGGCESAATVTEDMIPVVTNIVSEEQQEEAEAISLGMNRAYMAELTRLDGDNSGQAVVESKEVSVVLKATSVDKDLKVKIVNEKTGKVITGTAFEITVTDSESKTASYTDDDKDGIIYIASMTAGKCTISLTSSGQYKAAADITATVKANIDYAVVDVSDEIKSESEINAAVEDGGKSTGNSSAGSSDTLTDTVEYVESTKTPITEQTKTQVVDEWGQKVYSKLKKDEFGTDMYAVILSEPASYHTDADKDDVCDRCGASLGHTHTYDSGVVTDPTCTEKGYTTYTCTGCGDSYTDKETAALGHNYVDGVCTRCGAKDASAKSGEIEEPAEPEPEDDAEAAGDAAEIQAKSTDNNEIAEVSAPEAFAAVLTKGVTLVSASTEKIVYDTTSAPIYDTSSDPVYEITEEVVGYKYTGWQTIDGATYYYDKNGNYVTGTQIIQGIQYTFSSEGVRSGTIGIDVSKYQTNINWTKVKEAGINFVMIRCGYRGYGSGVLVQDPMFASHISGAKAAGLRVGIYFFSQAVTEAEAVEEASMAVKLAKQYGINLPIAIDSEYANGGAGRADGLSKAQRTKITVAFCKTVASSGYTPMVYASKSWFSDHLDVSSFGSYRIWVAHYAETCGYTGRYDMWQNTSKGTVSGISGYVDMDISNI